mgnify:CR=1 FL=1
MSEQKQPNLADMISGLMGQVKQGMGPGQPAEWWQTYQYPETVNFDPEKLIGCARSSLYVKALQGGVVNEFVQKMPCHMLDLANLDELVKSFDGRLVYRYDSNFKCVSFYVFSDGAVCASADETYRYAQMSIVTLDEKKVALFKQHYHSCFKECI